MALILTNSEMTTYASTLANSFSKGTSVVDALESITVSTASSTLHTATARIKNGLLQGIQINQTMSETGLFPDSVVRQVQKGEQAGSLDVTFSETADSYGRSADD